MAKHKFRKGLDLPIAGSPEQRVEDGSAVTHVALVADDYPGMRPRMLVAEGDSVKAGQQLFEDRKTPGVFHVSPGAGIVKGVHRGARRALVSVEIELAQSEDAVNFATFSESASEANDSARALLVESGSWTAFRTRPYGKVPAPDAVVDAIFVTAMDSNPLAPDVETVIGALENGADDFQRGIGVVRKLTEGKVFLCTAAGSGVTCSTSGISVEEFAGPHPAGTPGLHIHTLAPVSRNRMAWYIGYQDVIAIGHLFRTGALGLERIVSLAGPGVITPRLLKTRPGADLKGLTAGQLKDGDYRVLSGSVLAGRTLGDLPNGFLGRYHNQVTALLEGRERHFLGWIAPGFNKFSVLPAFMAKLLGKKSYDLTTDTNGGERAMVPIGMYEKVMPLDILPTFLLRALAAKDLERAEALGCLELEEEDLALCTFACPSKIDYGQLLRAMLTQIEKES
jgi:Na+-transporting NADH:ubiquinone oxidoreductase subunit A